MHQTGAEAGPVGGANGNASDGMVDHCGALLGHRGGVLIRCVRGGYLAPWQCNSPALLIAVLSLTCGLLSSTTLFAGMFPLLLGHGHETAIHAESVAAAALAVSGEAAQHAAEQGGK